MLLKACVRGSHGQKSFLTNKAPLEIQGIKRFFAKFSFFVLIKGVFVLRKGYAEHWQDDFYHNHFLKRNEK